VGDEATATATYSGGSLDGSSLVVRLVRSDRDWKLDRKLRVEFLNRARLERGYREVLVSSDYRFSEAGASCVMAETRQLTDAELADSVLGDDNTFARAAIRCDWGAVEQLLVANLKASDPPYSRGVVTCVERKAAALPAAKLLAVLSDIPGYSQLLFGCDRSGLFHAYRRQLAADGIEDATADCVIDRLRHRSAAEVVSLTYADAERARLFDECAE
jgi:hypothetical protein